MTDLAAQVETIAAWLAEAGIDRLELVGPSGTLKVTRRSHGPVTEVAEHTSGSDAMIRAISPCSGIFRSRHPWREKPAASIGATIGQGAPLGFLQMGTLLMPVTSPAPGLLSKLLIEDGAAIGFGDIVAEIECSSPDSLGSAEASSPSSDQLQ